MYAPIPIMYPLFADYFTRSPQLMPYRERLLSFAILNMSVAMGSGNSRSRLGARLFRALKLRLGITLGIRRLLTMVNTKLGIEILTQRDLLDDQRNNETKQTEGNSDLPGQLERVDVNADDGGFQLRVSVEGLNELLAREGVGPAVGEPSPQRRVR